MTECGTLEGFGWRSYGILVNVVESYRCSIGYHFSSSLRARRLHAPAWSSVLLGGMPPWMMRVSNRLIVVGGQCNVLVHGFPLHANVDRSKTYALNDLPVFPPQPELQRHRYVCYVILHQVGVADEIFSCFGGVSAHA
jgi:hypothetical protein